jgi:hypothetical protein
VSAGRTVAFGTPQLEVLADRAAEFCGNASVTRTGELDELSVVAWVDESRRGNAFRRCVLNVAHSSSFARHYIMM